MTDISKFTDADGRLAIWPSKKAMKEAALTYLAAKFEFGRYYAEKEINAVINKWHTFDDYFLLRRELVDNRALLRTPDGAKYRKGDVMKKAVMLSENLLRDITPNDAAAIAEINEACADYEKYSGRAFCKSDVDELIDGTAIPPGGYKDFFHVKLIEESSGLPVGFMAYYLGYPDGRSAYIGALFIKGEARRRGTGTAVVSAFKEFAKAACISQVFVGVLTENLPGLAFWTKQGFEKTGIVRPYEDTGKYAAQMKIIL